MTDITTTTTETQIDTVTKDAVIFADIPAVGQTGITLAQLGARFEDDEVELTGALSFHPAFEEDQNLGILFIGKFKAQLQPLYPNPLSILAILDGVVIDLGSPVSHEGPRAVYVPENVEFNLAGEATVNYAEQTYVRIV